MSTNNKTTRERHYYRAYVGNEKREFSINGFKEFPIFENLAAELMSEAHAGNIKKFRIVFTYETVDEKGMKIKGSDENIFEYDLEKIIAQVNLIIETENNDTMSGHEKSFYSSTEDFRYVK